MMLSEELTGYGIWSPYQGLMPDYFSSRRSAIVDFLWNWQDSDRDSRPYYPRKMTDHERKAWKRRQREGFKAVKVVLKMEPSS